ncbi:MAG: cation transporter [Bacteroidales bacterium]|nr:cation transporter [Bacteroidales bacterium]
MDKTIFKISQMDCPSEVQMIRTKLDGIQEIKDLDFNLTDRTLTVLHEGKTDHIEQQVLELKLGGKRLSTETGNEFEIKKHRNQKKVLWAVLIINFAFFILEMSTGILSRSMGLVADSLDMLADSFVYGISLFAVGGSLLRKKRIALTAGIFQIVLAVLGFLEIVERFINQTQPPDFTVMIVVASFALVANGICLYLLTKSDSKEAHMRASMIFTSNDVIVNLGVIVAGILVFWLQSDLPDLIIGSLVFAVVIRGAVSILKLGK